MRRSRDIQACVLLLAASTAILGCQEPHRDCVDSQNRKMPDSFCESGVHPGARILYGGSSGGRTGDTVIGGSTSRGGLSGILRGGFGSGAHAGGGE